MKIVALNHAESCRRPAGGRPYTPEGDRLDVLGSTLRDALAASAGSIPEDLAALARRIDARRLRPSRAE